MSREGERGSQVVFGAGIWGVENLITRGLRQARPSREAVEIERAEERREESDGVSVRREGRSVVQLLFGVENKRPFFLGRVLDGDPVVFQENVGSGSCLGDETQGVVAGPREIERGRKEEGEGQEILKIVVGYDHACVNTRTAKLSR